MSVGKKLDTTCKDLKQSYKDIHKKKINAQTPSCSIKKSPVHLTCMFLDCRKMLENQKKPTNINSREKPANKLLLEGNNTENNHGLALYNLKFTLLVNSHIPGAEHSLTTLTGYLNLPSMASRLSLCWHHIVVMSFQSACNWISGSNLIRVMYLTQNNDIRRVRVVWSPQTVLQQPWLDTCLSTSLKKAVSTYCTYIISRTDTQTETTHTPLQTQNTTVCQINSCIMLTCVNKDALPSSLEHLNMQL